MSAHDLDSTLMWVRKSPLPCVSRVLAVSLAVTVLCGAAIHAQSNDAQPQYEAAQRALAAGDYAAAEVAYENLRRLHPEVAEVHANLGVIYFHQKKFDQAIPELRQALKLKPTLTNTVAVLAMSLSEIGEYAEALPGLEKGFHSSDRQLKRMSGLQLERAYSALNRHKEAIEVAVELDTFYPDDPEVLYQNGRIFGNYAFLSMEKLSKAAPNSIWTHQAAAEAYESAGSYNDAITEYRQVLGIEPQRPGVHYRLGRTLLSRARTTSSAEDLAAAIREFEQELQVDPLNASAAYEIGEVHRNAGEFADAEKYFELALRKYSNFEEAHLGLAAVLMYLGNPTSALDHLQKAIALNPDNEVSWYRLSQVERSLGNINEVQNAIAKFHELHRAKPLPEESGTPIFASTGEVTKQTIDANAE